MILLDALGTLLELEPPAPRLREELKRRYGVRVTEAAASAAIAAEIAFYREHLDEGRDPESLAILRERCAAELRCALPEQLEAELPAPRDLVPALLASLNFMPYPDARPALIAAHARGVVTVVVSNWDISLHQVLDNAGLGGLLAGVLTAAEAGVRKPATVIFEQALRLVGARPEEAIHVGDSPEEDVAGARAAGIEAVLISRDGSAPDGVRTIATLAELGDIVGRCG